MTEPAGLLPDGKPRFRGRVRLADGTKSERFDVPQGMNEKQARTWVAGIQAKEDVEHGLLLAKEERARRKAADAGEAHPSESADAWHARFLTFRGEGPRSDSRYRWAKWIRPHIGEKPMTAITRDDIERVRDGLDDAIREYRKEGRGRGRLAPKAALNIWAVLTTAFKAACQAKRRDLRVREDNPCVNVLPPEKGDSRRKEWIYPHEVATLLGCAAVPIAWRELYAIACYLYLRPGELYELRWRDVDLSVATVHVTRAWDWMAGTVKPPKTRNGIRYLPIAPALLPLLTRMAKGRSPDEKVVPVLEATGKERKTSETMRAHLRLAGIDHARLFTDSATLMPIGFRSWRDTGITWLALSGVDVVKMQRRAGHDTIETTMGYVKAAEDLSGKVGVPFAELPPALVWPNERPSVLAPGRKSRPEAVPAQGFELYPRPLAK